MKTETAVTVNGKKSPKIVTALVAIGISMTLCIGFVKMLGSSFGIAFNTRHLIAASFLISLFYTVIHFFNKKWLSFIALISAPILCTAAVFFDWFDVRKGIYGLLYYIKLYIFMGIPGEFQEDINGEKTILAFLMAYCLTAVSISAFVLMKRRWIPAALVFYAPLFLFAVTNTDISPKPAPCLIAGSGVILLLLSNALRKKKQVTYDKMLVILTVPVFAFMFMLGGMFPQEKYNKDKVAQNILIDLRDRIEKAAGKDSPLRDLISKALNGLENTDFDDSFDTISPLFATPTNLSKVGPFNPSGAEVLKVERRRNPDYDGAVPAYGGNVLYLKVESNDHYANNTLTSTRIKGDVYAKGIEPPTENAQYSITVTPLRSASVDIVPYYADFYKMSNVAPTKLNPYNATNAHIFKYASGNLPVKTGNIYSKNYLDKYVYSTCLEVPYATDRGLISSGVLPEWYLDVYYGRTEMTDYEKVRSVTEFVRNLHPYNTQTPYPAEGSDFVVWFVKDANSGICVHYAVTSMVLLRMIGIPTRYVRGYVDQNSGLDKESIVYASQAHAWFEVFLPEYGWVMGDATPGYNIDENYFNIAAIAEVHPEVTQAAISEENGVAPTGTTTTTTEETTTEETTDPTEETTRENDPTDESSRSTDESGNSEGGDETSASVPKDNKKEKVEIPESLIKTVRFVVTLTIIVTVVAVLVLIGRVIFMFYWAARLQTEKINDRAIAHYHYYMLMARVFRIVYPSAVTEIAEKATFSGKDLTKKEYDTLVTTCKKIMRQSAADFSRHKMMLFRLMRLPEINDGTAQNKTAARPEKPEQPEKPLQSEKPEQPGKSDQ